MGRDDLLTRMNVMTGNWERIRSTAMAEALSDNSLQPPMSDQAARWRMLRELAKVSTGAGAGEGVSCGIVTLDVCLPPQRGNKAAELAVEATVTLGRKHADALQWTLAKKEFEKVDDADVRGRPAPAGRARADTSLLRPPQGLFRVYNRLERFADLASLAERLEDDSPWVVRIARTLADVGLCDGATNCFLRAGRVKDAVDTCIMLGHWERGIQLAEQYRIPQVESLFAKYAGHLLQRKDLAAKFEAAELYLRANKAMEAAGILDELCTHELSRKVRRWASPRGKPQLTVRAPRDRRAVESSAVQEARGAGGRPRRAHAADDAEPDRALLGPAHAVVELFDATRHGAGPGHYDGGAGVHDCGRHHGHAGDDDDLLPPQRRQEEAGTPGKLGAGRSGALCPPCPAAPLRGALRGSVRAWTRPHVDPLPAAPSYKATPRSATVARQLRAYDHVLDPWDVHAPMAVAGCLAGVRGAAPAVLSGAAQPRAACAAVVEDCFARPVRPAATGAERAAQRGECRGGTAGGPVGD